MLGFPSFKRAVADTIRGAGVASDRLASKIDIADRARAQGRMFAAATVLALGTPFGSSLHSSTSLHVSRLWIDQNKNHGCHEHRLIFLQMYALPVSVYGH